MSTLGWYQNSTQSFASASARPTRASVFGEKPSFCSATSFWIAEVSNGFLSTGSMRRLCCSPMCLRFSSTAEPRLLMSCTAPV